MLSEMEAYYRNFCTVNAESKRTVISDIATDPKKEPVLKVTLKDGTCHDVKQSEIEDFILANQGNFLKRKISMKRKPASLPVC